LVGCEDGATHHGVWLICCIPIWLYIRHWMKLHLENILFTCSIGAKSPLLQFVTSSWSWSNYWIGKKTIRKKIEIGKTNLRKEQKTTVYLMVLLAITWLWLSQNGSTNYYSLWFCICKNL
jgi:hypothetical protein